MASMPTARTRLPLDNFDIEGNTIFDSGDLSASGGRNVLLGGGRVAYRPTLRAT